jgi:hypothetical protein
MMSVRRLQANRKNARASTGPRTPAGRFTSARNARRHGLGTPIWADPILSDEAELMAKKISSSEDPHLLELARQIAEAEIDLLRVRRVRRDRMQRVIDCPLSEAPESS